MSGTLMLIITMMMSIIMLVIGSFIIFAITYRKAPEGFAVVRNGLGGPRVSMSGMLVIPVLHKYDLLGTTVQQIDHSVTLKDREMQDIPVTISLYVKPDESNMENLYMAHKMSGSDGMASNGAVANSMRDMAEQATAQVAGKFSAKEIHQRSFEIKGEVMQIIGDYFHGFVLEDLFVKPE